MNGAVCPSCGVAIIPGYVRCPKCRKPLPKRASAVEGGTAVEEPSRSLPVLVGLVAIVVIAGGLIAYFATRGGDKKPAASSVAPVTPETTAPETDTAGPTPDQPATTQTPTAPTRPQPEDIAAELERQLKKQRLWATVSVIGARAEVRSNSCSDPAMAPMLDGVAASFKAAGLTKLRCVEQSGSVVSDRDL